MSNIVSLDTVRPTQKELYLEAWETGREYALTGIARAALGTLNRRCRESVLVEALSDMDDDELHAVMEQRRIARAVRAKLHEDA